MGARHCASAFFKIAMSARSIRAALSKAMCNCDLFRAGPLPWIVEQSGVGVNPSRLQALVLPSQQNINANRLPLLLRALFPSECVVCMTRTELLINLIKFRMTRAGQAAGLSEAEAEQQAEAVVNEQGLRGWFGVIKARSGPDGAIVTNVETYAGF
jgi:hypothetical protein